MLLAFTFVPVFFSLILAPVSTVAPCSYVAFVTSFNSISLVSQGHWEGLLIEAVNILYLAIYCGIFYLCGRLLFRVSEGFEKPAGKISFQLIVLLIVLSCSFLRVIQGSSFVNWTGAYNFWSGCARFLETH